MVEFNESVKGTYKAYYNNAGTLIMNIDLDRSNYRLPETGGLGKDNIYKVATIMIGFATALLIYKNKIAKGEENAKKKI